MLIDTSVLPKEARTVVEKALDDLLREKIATDRLVNYQEAVKATGYTYQSLRLMVCKGVLKNHAGKGNHALLRLSEVWAYEHSKKRDGRPKNSEKA